MTSERKNELLDLVLAYNGKMRKDTKPMTNAERVYFLESHITAITGALDKFKEAVANGHGDEK